MKTPVLVVLASVATLAALACAPATTTTTNNTKPQKAAPAPEVARRGNSTTVHTLGIPPGQLPRAGRCRVWVPGRAPGRQADSRACAGIVSTAPPGSWIIYRATDNKTHVHVMDPSRHGAIYLVRYYDVDGSWRRDEDASSHREAAAAENRPPEDNNGNGNGNGNGRRRTS